MKKILGIVLIGLLWCSVCFAEPNVLKCEKYCETPDLKGEFSFQARLSMDHEGWGHNATHSYTALRI